MAALFPSRPRQRAVKHRRSRGALVAGVPLVALLTLGACTGAGGGGDDATLTAAEEATTSTATISETITTTVAASVTESDEPAPVEPEAVAAQGLSVEPARSEQSTIPLEYRSALARAESYLDFSSFSYAGLYDQLTSEYGEGFAAEAAQYAVNVVYAP